jgi:hypothetical protein
MRKVANYVMQKFIEYKKTDGANAKQNISKIRIYNVKLVFLDA